MVDIGNDSQYDQYTRQLALKLAYKQKIIDHTAPHLIVRYKAVWWSMINRPPSYPPLFQGGPVDSDNSHTSLSIPLWRRDDVLADPDEATFQDFRDETACLMPLGHDKYTDSNDKPLLEFCPASRLHLFVQQFLELQSRQCRETQFRERQTKRLTRI